MKLLLLSEINIIVLFALEAWLKWLRDGKGLWEVSGSSPNGDKNLPIKK